MEIKKEKTDEINRKFSALSDGVIDLEEDIDKLVGKIEGLNDATHNQIKRIVESLPKGWYFELASEIEDYEKKKSLELDKNAKPKYKRGGEFFYSEISHQKILNYGIGRTKKDMYNLTAYILDYARRYSNRLSEAHKSIEQVTNSLAEV